MQKEEFPYACCECGMDLTEETVVLIGSQNYCQSHALKYHPHIVKAAQLRDKIERDIRKVLQMP